MNIEDNGVVVEAFRSYAQAFRSLDARAIAPHFDTPAIMVTPQGVALLPDTAAVERVYTSVMAELSVKAYDRTDFGELTERRLSHDLSTVSGSGAWITKSGAQLSRFGMTYTFRLAHQSWRIVVAIIHDPLEA